MLELERRPGPWLDAFLGREGRRLDAERLRRFYAETYLEENPKLDVDDTEWKAELLSRVCAEAGIRSATSILEVGCGSGDLLLRMKQGLGASRAVGADYSASIAEVARAHTNLEIVVTDGARLPLEDGAVDVVYFADVLEHVLEPVAWLREVARVGKRLAFLVPLEWGALSSVMYVARRARGKKTNLEQYGHIWRWTRGDVLRMLAEAGLSLNASLVHHAPIRLEHMNRAGQVVERARQATERVSLRAAEMLFGSVALVGVARSG